MENGNCREMPGAAGLQRVLEEEPGDAGTKALVCAMRARPAAACGRGALFVSSPSLPARAGLCTANPGRHPAKRRATRATTLGLACAGLIGDAPLGQRGPELCGRLAQARRCNASTPDGLTSKWDVEAAG